MALDTRYRPKTYDDVLGQDASVTVLRQYIKEGKGRHQSYVFCGHHGSGKTTLGRILARALLCESPVDGSPCDTCPSCQTFLEEKTHECFSELDAATRSGKEDMLRITDEIQYSTFSGKRRIYLFDESHRLSKQALDAILKPMEDSIPGTEEKQLVCIFCTTEPERMQPTIFSRCAPAFVIRPVTPEVLGDRLARICTTEGIGFELEALVTISEMVESHIRDALKIVEGVSVVGPVTVEAVSDYLRLGSNDLVLSLLEALGSDLNAAVAASTELAISVSPSSAYERIADAALSAYRFSLGVGKIQARWKKSRIEALAARGQVMASIASRFAAPPRKPSPHTLVLDVAMVHHSITAGIAPSSNATVIVQAAPVTPIPTVSAPAQNVSTPTVKDVSIGIVPQDVPKTKTSVPGVVTVDPRAVGSGSGARRVRDSSESGTPDSAGVLDPTMFRVLVRHHLRELTGGRTGSPR